MVSFPIAQFDGEPLVYKLISDCIYSEVIACVISFARKVGVKYHIKVLSNYIVLKDMKYFSPFLLTIFLSIALFKEIICAGKLNM